MSQPIFTVSPSGSLPTVLPTFSSCLAFHVVPWPRPTSFPPFSHPPSLPPSLYTQEHASTHEHTTHTHVYLCICTRVHTHTHQCFRCSVSINENGLPFELFVCLNCCLHILPSGSPLFQNSFVSDISKMSTGYQLYVAEPLTENTHIHRGIPRIFAKLPSPGHRVRTSAVSQNSIILSLLCTEPCRAQELFCEGDLISCQGCPRL